MAQITARLLSTCLVATHRRMHVDMAHRRTLSRQSDSGASEHTSLASLASGLAREPPSDFGIEHPRTDPSRYRPVPSETLSAASCNAMHFCPEPPLSSRFHRSVASRLGGATGRSGSQHHAPPSATGTGCHAVGALPQAGLAHAGGGRRGDAIDAILRQDA